MVISKGKTLLAKALATEAGVSFYSINGGSLHNLYERKKMRRIFKRASKQAAAIIFIDEFDAVGFRRDGQNGHIALLNNDSTLLQEILIELDGFKKRGNVFIIATTNHKELLDEAVLRSGRFDKIINIPKPNKQSRKNILQYYLQRKNIEISNGELEIISGATLGLTGADLKNLVNVAAFHAVREKHSQVTIKNFDFALDRIQMGVTNTSIMQRKEDLYQTSIHECGHALVCLLIAPQFPLRKLTLVSKGSSLGHTAFMPSSEEDLFSKKDIDILMDIAMGGKAAEHVIFGDESVTTGCGSDLQNATQKSLAKMYAYGFGPVLMVTNNEQISSKYRYLLEQASNEDLKKSYDRTCKLLNNNKSSLKLLASKLLEKETLSGEEAIDLLGISKF